MSVQLDPHIDIEWIIAPEEDASADWPEVDCCSSLHAPVDPPAPPLDEDEWWPGRCIP